VLGLSTALLDKHLEGHQDAMNRGTETHQLDISYRDAADAAGLTAGHRAPDAPLRRDDGSALRLFDLFRGPHATRLTFGAPAGIAEDAGVRAYSIVAPGHRPEPGQLIAIDGHAFTDYAATAGTQVLVRPDGYLAWHRQG